MADATERPRAAVGVDTAPRAQETAATQAVLPDVTAALPDFALDALAELRAGHYRPLGWVRLLGRAWRQARTTAREHPTLTTSWAGVTAGLALAELGALAVEAACGEGEAARRASLGAALCLAYTQFDAYVHLGMNNAKRGTPLHAALGLPNALTLARSAVGSLLWGHLLGGRPASRRLLLATLVTGCATDIADGALARRQQRATRLGQYLDGTADCSFWLALGISLGAQRRLPRWLLAVLVLRWLVPMTLAFATYFGWVTRIPMGSTVAGKAAGVAQAATIALALAPQAAPMSTATSPSTHDRQDSGIVRVLPLLRRVVFSATAVLLVVAPLAQVRKVAHRS